MLSIESMKKRIMHHHNTNPIDNKDISRAWVEGFVSGAYSVNDEITDKMFDELIDWIRKEGYIKGE